MNVCPNIFYQEFTEEKNLSQHFMFSQISPYEVILKVYIGYLSDGGNQNNARE